ncbi:hypothetical protein F2Q68_00039762 [Brassica cretica]|uniref:Uncharacterized protein n=1 Tax=Brassica cretica TaxID=69181 RepID=A0A8S9MSA2_BRACR|nr:hypothetical protein F2Q68_00039762 [Brassica cretica]
MPEFYHLQPRDGTALVEEPSRGTRDVARPVSFLGEAMAKQVLAISRRFRRVPFLVSKEVLRHSRLWGNIARLTALVLYEEYQQAGTRRRRSFYTPPPHLARAAPPTARIRPDSAGTPTGGVRASARWELMKEWLEGRTEHWDPEEEYRQHLLWSEGLGRRPGGVSPISPSSDDIGLGGPSGDPEDPGITVGPEVIKNLEFYLFQFKGPYSACLGEAATDTCWDFAFCRSGAGHYRVPVLHAASAGSHYVARPVSFLGEAMEKQVLAISRRFRRVPFLVSKEVLRHSHLWGNIARLTASVLYDEYQQAGTRRRRSFYTPPPHLA